MTSQMTQQQMHARAVRKIQAGILFSTIAEQQKVDVDEAEVEAKLKELADQSGKHIAKVRAEYQGERRSWLTSQILHDKLLEYLLSRATITDASPAAPESSSDAQAENSGEPTVASANEPPP